MQRLVSEADTDIQNVFSRLPAILGEEAVAQVTVQTESIMQGWHHALMIFQDLKATTLTQVPELGPLFG